MTVLAETTPDGGSSKDAASSHLQRQFGKPRVLIDPPTALVQMDDHVARHRGLRLFTAPPLCSSSTNKGSVEAASLHTSGRDCSQGLAVGRTHRRRGRVPMPDRREAEASLSHDGDYAVAVCQVFNEAAAGGDAGCAVDDGTGPPQHEPEYGDRGFREASVEDLV